MRVMVNKMEKTKIYKGLKSKIAILINYMKNKNQTLIYKHVENHLLW